MFLLQGGNVSAGEVFLKEASGLKPLGVSLVPEVAFSPGGQANLTAVLDLSVPFWDAFYLLAANKLQIVAEFRVLARAQMSYLGLEFWIEEEQRQVCGFEARMFTMQIGEVACASTFDDLVIPEAGDTTVVEDRFEMSPERYAAETRKKNAIFGSICAVSLVLALASGVCGARMLKRAIDCRAHETKLQEQTPAPQDDKELEEATEEETPPPAPQEAKEEMQEASKVLEPQPAPQEVEEEMEAAREVSAKTEV